MAARGLPCTDSWQRSCLWLGSRASTDARADARRAAAVFPSLQRIAVDIRSFTDVALTFSVVLLNSLIDLISFSGAQLPAVGGSGGPNGDSPG